MDSVATNDIVYTLGIWSFLGICHGHVICYCITINLYPNLIFFFFFGL